jgi:hypothetical protein
MTELDNSKYAAAIRDIPMPSRIAKLPVSDAGMPIPWFVPWQDGKPAPHLSDPVKRLQAGRINLCWVCGETLGRFKCFVLGPMCCVTRTTSEPPCHRDCAEYAVKACPFLINPRMRRNPTTPEEHKQLPPGIMIDRNPKCAALWITHEFKSFNARGTGTLFQVGAPVEVQFYREGRLAKRAEVLESMESGIPILRDIARSDGREALAELELMYRKALELVPEVDF